MSASRGCRCGEGRRRTGVVAGGAPSTPACDNGQARPSVRLARAKGLGEHTAPRFYVAQLLRRSAPTKRGDRGPTGPRSPNWAYIYTGGVRDRGVRGGRGRGRGLLTVPVDVDNAAETPRVPRRRARVGHGHPAEVVKVAVEVDSHLVGVTRGTRAVSGRTRARRSTSGAGCRGRHEHERPLSIDTVH